QVSVLDADIDLPRRGVRHVGEQAAARRGFQVDTVCWQLEFWVDGGDDATRIEAAAIQQRRDELRVCDSEDVGGFDVDLLAIDECGLGVEERAQLAALRIRKGGPIDDVLDQVYYGLIA